MAPLRLGLHGRRGRVRLDVEPLKIAEHSIQFAVADAVAVGEPAVQCLHERALLALVDGAFAGAVFLCARN
jgi:hypothetical protein